MKDAVRGPDSASGATEATGALLTPPPPTVWFIQGPAELHFSSTAFVHTKWPFTLPQHGTIFVVKSDILCLQLLGVSRHEEA